MSYFYVTIVLVFTGPDRTEKKVRINPHFLRLTKWRNPVTYYYTVSSLVTSAVLALKNSMISMGSGKIMVLFFSTDISESVCSMRSISPAEFWLIIEAAS